MTLSHDDASRLYTNLNYQHGGFTPFASQKGFGAIENVTELWRDSKPPLYVGEQLSNGGISNWMKKGLFGIGDTNYDIYAQAGVDPSYTGTQLSTSPTTSIQNLLFGGSTTGWILLGVGAVMAFAILGPKR